MRLLAAGLGAVSGLLSYLSVEHMEFLWQGPLVEIGEWAQTLSPGIVFGVIMGVYFHVRALATPLRAYLFVPCDTAAWYIAFSVAIFVFGEEWFGVESLVVAGIAGGLTGGAGVALSAWILFPFFRRPKLAFATIGTGGILGSLLGFGAEGPALLALFVPWQAAVAVCLVWGAKPVEAR